MGRFFSSIFIVAVLAMSMTGCKGGKKDSAEVKAAAREAFEAMSSDKAEGDMPDVKMVDASGNVVMLSSLKGRYTYIDVWATWCGPCCREIPYMKSLAERMADDDNVQFVSISIDEDADAWKAKIDEEHPSWAQYILGEDETQVFCEALAVESIPRFIVMGPDGEIVMYDAPRPSDSGIEQQLRGLR